MIVREDSGDLPLFGWRTIRNSRIQRKHGPKRAYLDETLGKK
jgi:hypothetical protein